MNQEEFIRELMEKVMASLGDDAPSFEKKSQPATPAKPAPSSSTSSTSSTSSSTGPRITKEHYPLGEKIPDRIRSRTNKALDEFTLAKVLSGELTPDDFRISPETLEMQAQVAESANRPQLGNNMRRASELIAVPDDELLEAYDALRPYRKSKQELLDLADHLEKSYGCVVSAEFIREAAEVYEKRGRLKREFD